MFGEAAILKLKCVKFCDGLGVRRRSRTLTVEAASALVDDQPIGRRDIGGVMVYATGWVRFETHS
jgi:hypothetical protein